MLNHFLAAFLLLWSFLIQFLTKIDAKSSACCLPSPVSISHSVLIQNLNHFLFNFYSANLSDSTRRRRKRRIGDFKHVWVHTSGGPCHIIEIRNNKTYFNASKGHQQFFCGSRFWESPGKGHWETQSWFFGTFTHSVERATGVKGLVQVLCNNRLRVDYSYR